MKQLGSGCGAVGRAVASDARDPRLESSLWQFCLLNFNWIINWIEKTKIKKNVTRNGPTFKTIEAIFISHRGISIRYHNFLIFSF